MAPQAASLDGSDLILKPLGDMMVTQILLAKDGKLMILHNKKLLYVLKWIEYAADKGTMTFVSTKGHMQPLGMQIPKELRAGTENSHEITVTRVGEKGAEDVYIVPLIHLDYGFA